MNEPKIFFINKAYNKTGRNLDKKLQNGTKSLKRLG